MIDLSHIEWLNEHKLASEEFTIAYLVYKDKHEEKVNQIFQQYVENNAGKFDYKLLLNSLEDKDYLINYNKLGQYDLSKINTTDKFNDLLFVNKDIAFQEVLAIYPKTLEIRLNKTDKPKVFPAFSDLETDAMLYNNFIGGRRDKHLRFLYITTEYTRINGGLANYKFENYLTKFDSLAMMIEEGAGKGVDEFDVLS